LRVVEESSDLINPASGFNAGIGPGGINVAKTEALVFEFIADTDHNAKGTANGRSGAGLKFA
jgi:hypothetical protein